MEPLPPPYVLEDRADVQPSNPLQQVECWREGKSVGQGRLSFNYAIKLIYYNIRPKKAWAGQKAITFQRL